MVTATGSRERVPNTSYQESYCERVHDPHRLNFTSHLTRVTGTGFTANQRPAVYYSPGLDRADNPQLGLVLSDSFVSQTKRHYQPRSQVFFPGSLPNILNKPRLSGFHQLWSRSNAASVEERTPQRRWPASNQLTAAASLNNVRIGPKGDTGFTTGSDLQLYTFQEKHMFSAEPRRTPSSVMSADFLPPLSLQGTEAIPNLSGRSRRESGFAPGAAAPVGTDPPLGRASPPLSPRSEREAATERSVGKKEPTGFLVNAPSYQAFPSPPSDKSRFITQYQSKFCHCDDVEQLRSAHVISAHMDSGYNHRNVNRFLIRG
ncbi:protein phosphatase 1 regulatory subunit 32 isoform X2 [Betta splendens]|nr:protein phosphatase 1 regulatory subunit 32 isoform X2 [Betta splendens]XP_029009537.1 protein phosphatase 1 regulatory subunit 32 isoform X2 [Betta splendens]XP_029009538.1 protein phosphatase 1 regulatory subunit 32 isoform X2 [Betta splendens]XP_040927261.1 protein phosphatase 1 regulatory subunit 32 isoform X2 [Betta splendens]